MQQLLSKSKKLLTHIEDYVINRVESAKLNVAEKVSRLLSNVISAVVVAILLFCSILFASGALAYALHGWIGKMSLALLIVAGIYLLAGIIVWNARERLLRLPIMNSILQQLFDDEKEHLKN